MINRHTTPKRKRQKEKTATGPNCVEPSPRQNLLRLLLSISNRFKSYSAEKAIKQRITDLIIDEIMFQDEFSDQIDDNYRPIKVYLQINLIKYQNIIIEELIDHHKRNHNLKLESNAPSSQQPRVIAINPIQPPQISKINCDIILNFKISKFTWLKEIHKNSSKDVDQEIFDHAMHYMFLVNNLMLNGSEKTQRVNLDDLLWARAKYEVHRHSLLHHIDITQIGNISELLTRSLYEELETSYQDYPEKDNKQNN